MTTLRRIIILIFILSIVLSCVGCEQNTAEAEAGLKAVEGQYLANDGKSEYKIVIPEDAGSLVRVGAAEFKNFFLEATGVNLPVVTDKEVTADDKFISIGQTAFLQNTDITYAYEELGSDGYKIVTKGDDLYLIGGGEYGTLYAAYELLEILVDWDYFAKECYTLTTGMTQVPLYELDLMDIPDFAIRVASNAVVESNNESLYRLRQVTLTSNYISVKNYWAHNSFQYVMDSPDVNDKWFNAEKQQLCYTAHGDEAEYKKMLNASFITMKDALISTPERDSITYTIQDNSTVCDCEACTAMVEKYGALSSTVIFFLNDLNAMVREWFETEEGKPYARDLRIVFFAYNGYEAAPVTYNEQTGKYEANEGIQLDDGVYCMLAPIRMDYYRPITDPVNQEFYTNLKAWGDMAHGQLYLWYYSTNFRNYYAPYDCFDSFAENYRMAKQCDVYYLFDQRQTDERGVVSGWSTLKDYVCSKLAWDAEQNEGELINKFFNAYFGPAALEMREIYDQMRLLTSYNKEHNELGGQATIYLALADETYWPKDVLEQWLEAYDRAEEKIAPLKDKNPELYEAYLERIQIEKMSTLFLFVECYSYNTSPDLIASYKAEFKELGDKFGISKYRESTDISNLYSKWGIS